jgi:HAD superfamily hydrolase (TIGR01549 family)
MKKIKNIIFDFDGVILESNQVKIDGFYKLFIEFGKDKAVEISNYFKSNAGLSRYDIIRYFFLNFYKEEISKNKLEFYGKKYSDIVKEEVIKTEFVEGCKEFIQSNKYYSLFIVSSSDEKDLIEICQKIDVDKYFKKILGSPTKKEFNIKKIIDDYNLKKNETIYIGDSINDYHATKKNELLFIGRNSGVYDFNTIDDILVIEDLKQLNKKLRS